VLLVSERDGRGAAVAVLGASGYAGAIAAALVQRHPGLDLVAITSRTDAGRRLADLYPQHRVPLVLEQPDIEHLAAASDAALVAYPHAAAATTVAELHARGVLVVDFSADFRLRDLSVYEQWYGSHPAPELIEQAVYGLPELKRDGIVGARVVANPGCYPTAALLALAPLARAGLIEDVVIDAKSGISGSGREPTEETHFVSADENVNPYKVGGHRHTPEIEQELALLAARGGGDAPGQLAPITFVPHLVPLDQGELVSCYVRPTRAVEQRELDTLYRDAYAGEPFVELADRAPGVREVRETNLCRIFVLADERAGRLCCFAAIDNLWKGAASQAVQNLNLMLGLDEREGLGVLAA